LQQLQGVQAVLLLQLLQLLILHFFLPAGFSFQPLLHPLQMLHGRWVALEQVPLDEFFSVGLFAGFVANTLFLHVLEFLVGFCFGDLPARVAFLDGGFGGEGYGDFLSPALADLVLETEFLHVSVQFDEVL